MTFEELLNEIPKQKSVIDVLKCCRDYDGIKDKKAVALNEIKLAEEFFKDLFLNKELDRHNDEYWQYWKTELELLRSTQIESLESEIEVTVKGQNNLMFLIEHKDAIEENTAFQYGERWYLVKEVLYTKHHQKAQISKIEAKYAF